jgi:hypothetical protein
MKSAEAVNRKMTDNKTAKRKRTNGQTMIYKALHRKLKFEQHDPYYKREWIQVIRKD